jgi:phosphinothricin acetyltransferase
VDWNNTFIEEANTADVKFITNLYNDYLGRANLDTEPISDKYYLDFILNKSLNERLFILKFGTQNIGWAQIKKYSHKKGYQFACETSTYLATDYQGFGLGSNFKKYVIDQCGKLGYKHIVAKILDSNKKSIEYNLKLGYEIVGIQHKVGYANGKLVDVVIMQYLFE